MKNASVENVLLASCRCAAVVSRSGVSNSTSKRAILKNLNKSVGQRKKMFLLNAKLKQVLMKHAYKSIIGKTKIIDEFNEIT